jgi:hypothetical protein
MKVGLYKNPDEVKLLGWLETCQGKCIGFINLDGTIDFDWCSLPTEDEVE